MSKTLDESAIVAAVAQIAAQRAARAAIVVLRGMKDTLSGDDSELKTTWDEICVEVQYEPSPFWDEYFATVKALVRGYVGELPAHEREAIWLQTEAGIEWDCEEPESRPAYPVSDDDISEYITKNHIYPAAGRWSNPCIRAFMERCSKRD